MTVPMTFPPTPTSPPTPAIETALQGELRGPSGAARQQAHLARLARLEALLSRSVAAGLPPADYALAQRLLRMLQTGQRVLASLATDSPSTPAQGPALVPLSLPAPTLFSGERSWPPPAPSRLPPD